MRYIYTLDTNNPGVLQNLPNVWTSPAGIQYTDFKNRPEAELNSLNWYAANEIFPSQTEWEERTGYDAVFNQNTNRFDVTWIVDYMSIDRIRDLKKEKLREQFTEYTKTLFNLDNEDQFKENIIRAIALLAAGKTSQNNTYLANIVNIATRYTNTRNTFDSKLIEIDTLTDPVDVIALVHNIPVK